MAIIKFINKSLIDVKASEYIKDGVASSNLDIKSVSTSEGKSKNVCRISIPGNWSDSVKCIDDAIEALARDDKFVHKNKLIEKYKNVTTTLSLSDTNEESASSVYYIMAIPYNGTIDIVDISADLGSVKLLNATTIKTESFAMSEKSKLKFAKILYMIVAAENPGANITIDFRCKSYPKTDDGMKMVERALSMTINAENIDNIIPDVVSVDTTELTPDENGEYALPAPVKFNQMLTSHDARDAVTITAENITRVTICESTPYSLEYTGVIKEKKANDNRNKSDKPFKPNKRNNGGKFYVSDKRDDSAKKANAHAKCINKLNKAKGKFAE